eukprot:scaffold2859_cov349-Pavlova_lutheri.AAC.81
MVREKRYRYGRIGAQPGSTRTLPRMERRNSLAPSFRRGAACAPRSRTSQDDGLARRTGTIAKDGRRRVDGPWDVVQRTRGQGSTLSLAMDPRDGDWPHQTLSTRSDERSHVADTRTRAPSDG